METYCEIQTQITGGQDNDLLNQTETEANLKTDRDQTPIHQQLVCIEKIDK
jgi:hypothetical protein